MPTTSRQTDPLVFFFGSNEGLREGLRLRLGAAGVTLRVARTLAGLMCAAGKRPVAVLILDIDCLPTTRTAAGILDRLEADTGHRPRLFCLIGQRPTADDCREALATFQAPFEPGPIAARVIASLDVEAARRQRVLIVDAQPDEGDELEAVLRGAGLVAERVSDPQQVLPALERSPTDLLLLDLSLPNDASLALTGQIRDHEDFFDLPIVFLSAPSSPEHPGEVLRLGAAEYLARPVAADRLLAAVRGRLAQVRASTPPERRTPLDGGAVLPLVSYVQLVKRLDHVIMEQGEADIGEAVLCIRLDDSPTRTALTAAGLDGARRHLLELVATHAGSALHAACLSDDDCYAWLRCETIPEVMEVAEAIREGFGSWAPSAGPGAGRLTVSIGVGPFRPTANTALILLSRAEAAGVQARQSGGNQVQVHEEPAPPVDSGSGDHHILQLLRGALAGSGFRLVYQPILSLHKSHRERYEVLLRLRTPHGEIMPPLSFLPVAARHGLLPALDRWVLAGALATLRAEQEAGRRTRLMIHQTVASVAAPGWLQWTRQEILRLNLIRQRPVLEFVARDVLADETRAREIFPELGRLGIDVCLAGITDSEDLLALVSRVPIGFVKLARELTGREAGTRLAALVDRLRLIGPQVIATGIEDPEAIGRVWSSGVDYIQGNFIQFPEETLNFQFHESLVG